MTRSTEGRLARLERRQPRADYDHLSDEELARRIDDALVQIVEEFGIDEARAQIDRELPLEGARMAADRLAALQAAGRIPAG